VDKVPPLTVEPQVEPTAVLVRTQMGWVVGKAGVNTSTGQGEMLTRERFYEEHRLQRTTFEIAREITEVFAGGLVTMGKQPTPQQRIDTARLLFPQVVAVVAAYLDRRVTLSSPNARIEEVALARYRDIIVERLVAAIEPDTDAGEAALLPRIEKHRPIGTTADVQFRTTKATKGTMKSHVSHVVLDSTWESSAAFFLEQSPRVLSYVKNDRLDFEILYEWQGGQHSYIPDFVVRLDDGMTWLVEIKGQDTEQDRAKWQGADKWVRAVNNHGGFGTWKHVVCKDASAIGRLLATTGTA
jgi:type III restriction enzyme